MCKKPIEKKISENYTDKFLRSRKSDKFIKPKQEPESDLVNYTKQYVNRSINTDTYMQVLRDNGINPNNLGVKFYLNRLINILERVMLGR